MPRILVVDDARLTIYDLGGLCDRTIARTMGKDQSAFYDYVFMQLKPSFIHVHPHWWIWPTSTEIASFEETTFQFANT